MGNVIITANDLGKRYLLRHRGKSEPYRALRDVVSQGVRQYAARLLGGGEFSSPQQRNEEFWALRCVNFKIGRGDRIGIIGRNGAGKSTLLKILSRITEPSSGEIRIKGRVASLLEVGTGFHPELSGRENIFLNGALLGMKRWEIQRKFDEIVAFAEVEKFLDTPVKRYSSGMYVRLAFAVAAHLEPEILVVDEVLAVGDAQFQRKCLAKMEDVSAQEGRTLLFVSHSMESVRKLCNLGIYLEQGQVACHGSAEECIDRYTCAGLHRAQNIVSHCTKFSDKVELVQVLVNGAESDHVVLPAGARTLSFDLLFKVVVPTRLAVEVRILEASDHVVANFCPSHFSHELEKLSPGLVHCSATVEFPRFTKGDYYLSIYVTDPGKEGLLDLPRAVRLMAESESIVTGDVLANRLGHGALILDGEVRYRHEDGS